MEENSNRSVSEKIDRVIARIEEVSGLPSNFSAEFVEEVSKLLTRTELEALTADECNFASLNVTRYIFYLANCASKTRAKLHWYEIELNKLLGTFMENDFAGIFGAENKRITAIMAYEDTSALYEKIQLAKVSLARLDGMIDSLKMFKSDINDIKISKLTKQKVERNYE